MTATELSKIVELAGVQCYAPVGCTVYADNRILSFFPKQDVEFKPYVPKDAILRDFLTNDIHDNSKPLKLNAKGGISFYVDK